MDRDDFRIDPLTAYRIAKARGMAERSRMARHLWSAAARAVRGLFTVPRAAGEGEG